MAGIKKIGQEYKTALQTKAVPFKTGQEMLQQKITLLRPAGREQLLKQDVIAILEDIRDAQEPFATGRAETKCALTSDGVLQI